MPVKMISREGEMDDAEYNCKNKCIEGKGDRIQKYVAIQLKQL